MANYVIATTKSWNIKNARSFINHNKQDNFLLVTEHTKLTKDFLDSIQPRYVFFPHWSWIIPKAIYENFNCIVFHMTDLPFGRGGSPLQNLLVRGVYNTKVSAIKVCAGVDEGPVYFKEPVDISEGNADEIFTRISGIIFNKMIPMFLKKELIPVEQTGEVVSFKRRKPEDSELPDGLSQRQIYDFIRMLDGEGYPPAFIKNGNSIILLRNGSYVKGQVTATATFVEENNK